MEHKIGADMIENTDSSRNKPHAVESGQTAGKQFINQKKRGRVYGFWRSINKSINKIEDSSQVPDDKSGIDNCGFDGIDSGVTSAEDGKKPIPWQRASLSSIDKSQYTINGDDITMKK